MSIFSRFPYTDFHRLNADWILDKIKEMLGLTQQAAETVEGYDDRLTAAETAVAGAVRFDRVQDLTALQQGQARDNIQAAPANMFGAVRYDQVQLLEAPQKARARSNIGAAEVGVADNCVRFDTIQELTALQQGQARDNIQAAPADMFGAVRYDEVQLLEAPQKARARSNIGAAEAGVIPSGVVRYDTAQSLSVIQAAQARVNIGAAEAGAAPDGVVRYDVGQALTDNQKSLARSNIGAAEAGAVPSGVVRYDDEQSLTDAQAEQARENINIMASLISNVTVTGNTPTIDIAEELDGSAYETLIQCTGTAITTITISTSLLSNLLVTIVFTTGATAPTFDSPLAIRGLDDLIPAANTTYEISIRGNRAAWKSWEVTT